MSDIPPQEFPAGWYADPGNASAQRWWDGQRWTDFVQPVGPPAVAAAEATHGRPPAAGPRHRGRSSLAGVIAGPASRVCCLGQP